RAAGSARCHRCEVGGHRALRPGWVQDERVLTIALILAGLAALLHVYIWVLESLRWEAPSTRRTFGTSAEQARVTKPLAFNQGFYNLFLAIVTAAGIIAAGTN